MPETSERTYSPPWTCFSARPSLIKTSVMRARLDRGSWPRPRNGRTARGPNGGTFLAPWDPPSGSFGGDGAEYVEPGRPPRRQHGGEHPDDQRERQEDH